MLRHDDFSFVVTCLSLKLGKPNCFSPCAVLVENRFLPNDQNKLNKCYHSLTAKAYWTRVLIAFWPLMALEFLWHHFSWLNRLPMRSETVKMVRLRLAFGAQVIVYKSRGDLSLGNKICYLGWFWASWQTTENVYNFAINYPTFESVCFVRIFISKTKSKL